ncbi:hypothetical protein AHiyo4_09620 [Arthrobacter sp. Hiyo4]|nr:hypothetical protein AHiyo4_09620 [Arthrobacter sp. Hiyo4]
MNPAGSLNPSPRTLEVETLDSFDRLVAADAVTMQGWHAQSLDLRGREGALETLDVEGAIFLGCTFGQGVEERLRRRGALIFPRLHDHAIGDALEGFMRSDICAGRITVGVMGGHEAQRGTPEFAQAAELGRLLAQTGRMVATGGGPGAMEAANLGAYLSRVPHAEFTAALAGLGAVPGFRPSVSAWAREAAAVVERHPGGTPSLGIPTWFYGHEPPNYFATHIAKYFANAIREAILLELCDGGIIFLPGAAGTVQEIFQDACENYYSAREAVTPMVLVGRQHWEHEYPAWPMLRRLAAGRAMEDRIFLVDSVDEALAVLGG